MTIGEVSTLLNISADTLRYYEKIGLIDYIERNNGIRNYQQKDLNQIEFIKCMRAGGLSIEALLRYMELYKAGEETLEERKGILIEQKAIVQAKRDEIQQTFERLETKIENYENLILERERMLLKEYQS